MKGGSGGEVGSYSKCFVRKGESSLPISTASNVCTRVHTADMCVRSVVSWLGGCGWECLARWRTDMVDGVTFFKSKRLGRELERMKRKKSSASRSA